jgi:hypothetical protein
VIQTVGSNLSSLLKTDWAPPVNSFDNFQAKILIFKQQAFSYITRKIHKPFKPKELYQLFFFYFHSGNKSYQRKVCLKIYHSKKNNLFQTIFDLGAWRQNIL